MTKPVLVDESGTEFIVTFNAAMDSIYADLDKYVWSPWYIYVRPDGSDSNDGSANDAAHALRTVNAAINKLSGKVLMAQVTIYVADGTYTNGITLLPTLGTYTPSIIGNVTTPANCIISVTSSTCINMSSSQIGSRWNISGFKLTAATAGNCISVSGEGSILYLDKIEFGAVASTYSHMDVSYGGKVIFLNGSTYSISGNATYHIKLTRNASFMCCSSTVTLTGTLTISFFVYANSVSDAAFIVSTFTGTFTGSKYSSNELSRIYSSQALPGSTAGSTSTGGMYA